MRNWIQDHAISVLLRTEEASTKAMRPPDVPANLFSYHLEGLVTDGIIIKTNRGKYQLTPQGTKLAGRLSTSTYHQSENPKTVIILFSQNEKGEVLLFRWSRQPYLRKVTLPWDRVHFGRSLEDSLTEAVVDKLGSKVAASYLTTIILRVEHKGALVSHMTGLVYEVDSKELSLPLSLRNGKVFFAKHTHETDALEGLEEVMDYLLAHAYTVLPEFSLKY